MPWCLPRKNIKYPLSLPPCARVDFFLSFLFFILLFICLFFFRVFVVVLCSMEDVVFHTSSISCSVLTDMCSKQCILNHSIHQLPITVIHSSIHSSIHPWAHQSPTFSIIIFIFMFTSIFLSLFLSPLSFFRVVQVYIYFPFSINSHISIFLS